MESVKEDDEVREDDLSEEKNEGEKEKDDDNFKEIEIICSINHEEHEFEEVFNLLNEKGEFNGASFKRGKTQ